MDEKLTKLVQDGLDLYDEDYQLDLLTPDSLHVLENFAEAHQDHEKLPDRLTFLAKILCQTQQYASMRKLQQELAEKAVALHEKLLATELGVKFCNAETAAKASKLANDAREQRLREDLSKWVVLTGAKDIAPGLGMREFRKVMFGEPATVLRWVMEWLPIALTVNYKLLTSLVLEHDDFVSADVAMPYLDQVVTIGKGLEKHLWQEREDK